jgi:hypothetical protein
VQEAKRDATPGEPPLVQTLEYIPEERVEEKSKEPWEDFGKILETTHK